MELTYEMAQQIVAQMQAWHFATPDKELVLNPIKYTIDEMLEANRMIAGHNRFERMKDPKAEVMMCFQDHQVCAIYAATMFEGCALNSSLKAIAQANNKMVFVVNKKAVEKDNTPPVLTTAIFLYDNNPEIKKENIDLDQEKK